MFCVLQTTTTTPNPIDKIVKFVKIMKTLTNVNGLSDDLTKLEVETRLGAAIPVSLIMSTKGDLNDDWKELRFENDEPGAEKSRVDLDNYLIYNIERLVDYAESEDDQAKRRKRNAPNGDEPLYSHLVSSNNIAAEVSKWHPVDFGRKTIKFPNWEEENWESIRKDWGDFLDPVESMEITNLDLFDSLTNKHEVNLLLAIQDTLPDSGRKNPVQFRSNDIRVISRTMTVKFSSNIRDKYDQTWGHRIKPNSHKLKANPFILTFGHRPINSIDPNLNEDRIKSRKCAIWNPDIGIYGAWDTDGVITKFTDHEVSNCIATKLGTFAIVVEIEDEPYAEPDHTWLIVVKSAGYSVSMLLLMFFIVVILASKYLREMFHSLSLNFAVALFMGNLSMITSEIQMFRDDPICCLSASIFISFYYTAAAVFLFLEVYAVFMAVVTGEIGGRLRVYWLLGWGVPLICVGVNILLNFEGMDNDPRCFIGWKNHVKWIFFYPVLTLLGMALVISTVTMCNIATPQLRKESIAEDLISLAKGLFGLTFFYCLTWSWAPLAYLDFPALELPSFYPGFQILNSVLGLLAFIFIGIGSQRFRIAVTGQVKIRVNIFFISNLAFDNFLVSLCK